MHRQEKTNTQRTITCKDVAAYSAALRNPSAGVEQAEGSNAIVPSAAVEEIVKNYM
jgi:hypothetical protein